MGKKSRFLMVKVDPEFEKRVREFAEKKGFSKSALIRHLLIKEMESEK